MQFHCSTLLFVTGLLLVACGGQPTSKFQPDNSPMTAGQSAQWTFDGEAVGGLPTGAESFNGAWAIRAEADAPSQPNALCQTGTADFPALVLSNTVYTDVTISSSFKPISGQSDQAGGIIFRVQDQDNYYILRANALENNVNFYKYAGGTRTTIQEGNASIAAGQWQELRVEATGNHLRGYVNGQLVVEANDNTYKAGRVGLWTKADSTTCFDNLKTMSN
jgi:hypothetical protein